MAAKKPTLFRGPDYGAVLDDVAGLLTAARSAAARSVNAVMTATYWLVGRRVVEGEQRGKGRADYGAQLIHQLSVDLTARFGRGFGRANLFQMRAFFLAYREIVQTASGQFTLPERQSASRLSLPSIGSAFPLPWSNYVRLLAVKNPGARRFYEAEALRGGWTNKQLDRQIQSQFYERTLLSKNKAGMLAKGQVAEPADEVSADEVR